MPPTPSRPIEVQGHRGACGLSPENTLAAFEIALDLGVTSIETDVHLTKDDVPVLFHDATIKPNDALVRSRTLEQLRHYRVRGPTELPTALATRFCAARGIDPCGIPTLTEFFEFVATYAGPLGVQAAKAAAQQERAKRMHFDLELKRVPFRPETIGDGFDGRTPAVLERRVVAAIHAADVVARTRVRSFDHRSCAAIRMLEPTLATGLLVHNTAPVNIAHLLAAAGAKLYCPDYEFVDEHVVRQAKDAGACIIPYTVNTEDAWERLVDWGVDGITTDYPDRLIAWLCDRGVPIA